MRKKINIAVFVLVLVLLFSSCGAGTSPSIVQQGPEFSAVEQPSAGAEIAMLLQSEQKENTQSQAIWAVLSRFAGENGTTSGQYLAEGENQEAAFAALELAVKGGAKLVLVLGEETATMLERAPMRYPDVQFVFVDARGRIGLEDNSAAIEFAWGEAGWLAGYAVVYERLANLGYWEIEDRQAMEYAAGFALGAQAAAEELELAPGAIKLWGVLPQYSEEEIDWKAPAKKSFEEGMQLLLVNVQAALADSRTATRQTEGRLVTFGLPTNAGPADRFLNVLLDCRPALQELLEHWKNEKFPGGKTMLADVANTGVGLELGENEFEFFTPKRYEIAQGAFASGEFSKQLIELLYPDGADIIPAIARLPLELVNVRVGDEVVTSQGVSLLPAPAVAEEPAVSPPESIVEGYQQTYTVPQEE